MRDMTQGKPLRIIFSFAVSLLAANLMTALYSLVDSIDCTGKSGTFCKLCKYLKDTPTVLTFAAVHIQPHGLRHHIVNATVTQGTWLPGYIGKIRYPVHAFVVASVKPFVAYNFMHILIQDSHGC